jgi:hypothetical protein
MNNGQLTPNWLPNRHTDFFSLANRPAKRKGDRGMGQIVKCDICGKIYNESHLTTHKRLSHGKRHASLRSSKNGTASVEVILSLYEGLSEDQKKKVRDRLVMGDQTRR